MLATFTSDRCAMVRRWQLVIAVWIATGSQARADVPPDDAAQAARLFEQGRKEIAANRIDPACEAFAASLLLDPQLGTRLNLAACRAQQKQWNEAYSMFEEALAEADRSGKGPRATYAREQLRALDAKLVRLHVVLTDPDGITVAVNGATIDPAKRHLAAPGKLAIDVSAPDKRRYHVEKIANAGAELTVDVPALQPMIDADGSTVTPVPPPTTPIAQDRVVERRQPRGATPFIVAGAGGALLLTAGVLTLHARSRWTSATESRDRGGVTSAQHEADAATILSIAGGVAVAAGVVLWMRGGTTERVTIAPTSNGFAIRGAF